MTSFFKQTLLLIQVFLLNQAIFLIIETLSKLLLLTTFNHLLMFLLTISFKGVFFGGGYIYVKLCIHVLRERERVFLRMLPRIYCNISMSSQSRLTMRFHDISRIVKFTRMPKAANHSGTVELCCLIMVDSLVQSCFAAITCDLGAQNGKWDPISE